MAVWMELRVPPPPEVPPTAVRRLEDLLLAGYNPKTSLAWPGAAPEAWQAVAAVPARGAEEELSESAPDDGRWFRKHGFTVRRLQGPGADRAAQRFCESEHYLPGAGMAGVRFAMLAPTGEIVGIAAYAPASNPRTARGMQVALPGDEDRSALEQRHLGFTESEYLDCTRLCVAARAPSGALLGTGAESYLYRAVLRAFAQRNRSLWRAIRMTELGLPLGAKERGLLRVGTQFLKCVRSFADTAEGHTGQLYWATAAWFLGTTQARRRYVGRRSGEPASRRSLSKIGSGGSGAVHQALRAVWEGSRGEAHVLDGGSRLASFDLQEVVREVPGGLPAPERQARLRSAWREASRRWAEQTTLRLPEAEWSLSANLEGYQEVAGAPKLRYAHFLGSPWHAWQLARRCRYLSQQLAAAEAAWKVQRGRVPREAQAPIDMGWPRLPLAKTNRCN